MHRLRRGECFPQEGEPFLQAWLASSCSQPGPAAALLQAKGRRRLDELCGELFAEHSPRALVSWIAQGKVTVDGRVQSKAGTQVAAGADVRLNARPPKFVSRCGCLQTPAHMPARDSGSPRAGQATSWRLVSLHSSCL